MKSENEDFEHLVPLDSILLTSNLLYTVDEVASPGTCPVSWYRGWHGLDVEDTWR